MFKLPTASEKEIQESILGYLKILERKGELYAFRTQAAAVGIKRRDGSTGFLKTGRKGAPDITVCYKGGIFIGIEVKTPKNIKNLSEFQELTNQIINKLDGYYWIVTSVDDLERRLRLLREEIRSHGREVFSKAEMANNC